MMQPAPMPLDAMEDVRVQLLTALDTVHIKFTVEEYAITQQEWDVCDNSRQMLRLLFLTAGARGSTSHRLAVRTLVAILEPVMRYTTEGDATPLATINLMRRYSSGEELSIEDVRAHPHIMTNASSAASKGTLHAIVAATTPHDIYLASDAAADTASVVALAIARDAHYACLATYQDAVYAIGKMQCETIRSIVPTVPVVGADK